MALPTKSLIIGRGSDASVRYEAELWHTADLQRGGMESSPSTRAAQQRMPSAGNVNCCARSDMEQAQLNWIANFISGIAISLTRYFYKPRELRTLDQIRCDMLPLEKETEGLLGEIIGGARS